MASLTVIAVMCHLLPAIAHVTPPAHDCSTEEDREVVTVTDNDLYPQLGLFECQAGNQFGISDWKMHHRIYFQNSWRIAAVQCIAGEKKEDRKT